MKKEEITVKYLGEFRRFSDIVLIDVQGQRGSLIRIKCRAEEGELELGLWYRFFGTFKRHPKYGPQFEAQSFILCQPLDEDGLIAYLRRAPFVGTSVARRLVKTYGQEAVRKLREDPAQAAKDVDVKSFTAERARESASFLEGQAHIEEATIDLMALLAGRGFPRDTVKNAIRAWGNRAAEIIRRDPYKLMAFSGIGFKKTDELYLKLGHPRERIKRQALCVRYACDSDRDGHTWLPAGYARKALTEALGPRADLKKAAKLGVRAGRLAIRRKDGETWIASSARASVEKLLGELLARMFVFGEVDWPRGPFPDVSEHQAAELEKATKGRLSLFLGGPGTGKTYSAARLVKAILEAHGAAAVAVVAPTGKAAARISEAMAGYDLPVRAKTIHSFLRVEATHGRWSFTHDAGNPVRERFVIVDEASMLSTDLLCSLVEALRPDGHLLLVGDVNQLPPVGHGAPLRDLIAAGASCGMLTEIRRNSGAIVETCAKIRERAPFELPPRIELPEQNLMLVPRQAPIEISEEILRFLRSIRGKGEHDPVWDCQVLVAVNAKSELSRERMNKLLQAELNAANRPRKEAMFWPRDKVICLSNSFFPAVKAAVEEAFEDEAADSLVVNEREDGELQFYVANGELGCVVEDAERFTIVEFFQPKRVCLVPKGGEETLALGYALTCHKAQGSEWPIVVVALDPYPGARMVADRSYYYTAISRAKKACILVGQENVLRRALKTQKIDRRYTFLVDEIEQSRAAFVAEAQALEEEQETAVVASGPAPEEQGCGTPPGGAAFSEA